MRKLGHCRGTCIALKGPEFEAELAEAVPAIRSLGGGAPAGHRLELPITPVGRSLILIPKVGPTPPHLPRRSGPGRKQPGFPGSR